MYKSLSRDKYDLHYDRRLPERLATPRGTAAEQPYDSEFDEITDTENAMNGLIKKRNILLNRESQHLKSILDDNLFYFERLKEVDPTAAFGINLDALPRKSSGSRPDAFNERNVLQKRTTEATRFRETLQRKVKAGLDAKVQSFQGVNGENPDVLLYRIQRRSTQTSSARRFSNSLLEDRPPGWHLFGDITNDAILNHMSGAGDPTLMISLEESPARLTALLKNVPDCDTSATNVQVFSVRMLQHLSVPIARSTDLYRDRLIPTADLKKDGRAQGVSGTHWLVTNWLPEEAMVTKLGLLEFLAFARDRGVIDNITTQNVLDTGCSVRFSPRDFLESSLVDPSPFLQTMDETYQLPKTSNITQPSFLKPQDKSIDASAAPRTSPLLMDRIKSQDTSSKSAQTSGEIPTGEPDALSDTSDQLVYTPCSLIDHPPESCDLRHPTTPRALPSAIESKQFETSCLPQKAETVILQLADLAPSVFGIPTPLTPRYRNIKSPFTAAMDNSYTPKGFFATETIPFGIDTSPTLKDNRGSVLKPNKAPAVPRTPSVFQAIGSKRSQAA